MKYLTTLFFLVITTTLEAQTFCSTPTAVNSRLSRFNTSRMAASYTDSAYCLRVYFHIIRKSDGTGATNVESNIIEAYKILNEDFNSHGIYFIWDMNIDYIDNSYYYNYPSIYIYNVNNHSNGIDIYLYGDEVCEGGRANGIANSTELYLGGYLSLFPTLYLSSTHVISHEMGHVLGLFHTHHGTFSGESDYSTCPELANGSNSDICGDYIEDTPADPFLNFNVNPSTGLWLGYGIRDENGDLYQPDTRLIMSYTHPLSMSYFSLNQGEKMKLAIANTLSLRNAVIPFNNFTILGTTHIYNSAVYSIQNLPDEIEVRWSLSGNNHDYFRIEIDSISSHQCTITQKPNANFNGSSDITLSAHIIYNNSIIHTITKALTTPYIDGPALTCSYSTYEVNPIYQNQTVEWSFSGIGGGTLVLGNTRSFQVPENACGIVNTDNRVIRGTLTATIKSGNDVVGTLKKKVGTGVNFAGTWYQQASLHDTLNATPKDFEDGDFLDIVSGRKVYLQSAGFIGATITHTNSGMSTLGWTNNNGVISFTPVCNGNSGSITINATKGSCQKFTLRLRTGFSILDPILNTAPTLDIEETGRDYTFTLVPEGGNRNDELQQWNLSIVQYETGKTVHNSTITRTSVSVNTTAWQPGIYIVTATVGDKKIAKKIIIGG